MSQAEETNHQHFCTVNVYHNDHLNHLSTDHFQAENQQLWKAYQSVKKERDMLNKALHAYFAGLALPKTL